MVFFSGESFFDWTAIKLRDHYFILIFADADISLETALNDGAYRFLLGQFPLIHHDLPPQLIVVRLLIERFLVQLGCSFAETAHFRVGGGVFAGWLVVMFFGHRV